MRFHLWCYCDLRIKLLKVLISYMHGTSDICNHLSREQLWFGFIRSKNRRGWSACNSDHHMHFIKLPKVIMIMYLVPNIKLLLKYLVCDSQDLCPSLFVPYNRSMTFQINSKFKPIFAIDRGGHYNPIYGYPPCPNSVGSSFKCQNRIEAN